ncbi:MULTISPECIES: RusA family crossover junction endodeoxyribonuclease [Bacillus cereus group]|uniref:RusA family crossover junction endodeoxyribonuclease n=1 Tax=Bacillus cereus group TaxID=86661 RepID=UPI001238446D|nr:RusA family crossover junction endodeoxyribonuclease [Bacillus cereus]KAA6457058.1 RusA family crossover junction endodeoxyribonuclease [Bacillus cereus]KAB2418877.1 RusA family crossover junction endodeoxyribonuclease [Bacillus cereus]KAB2439223.1 RusA family crossover junction endodeoxyribonuclease [Bacillus cereus]KAB2470268.1 RusA family crossover junction endodeoxyribonuclease [Bacillus cereus]
MIKFTVLGEPVAQGRPRAGIRNGKISMRDPMKSRNFKQYVRLAASKHAPEELLEGPLFLEVKVYKPLLKKFSKKKRLEAEQGLIRPTTKPDVDNYAKGILDGLNSVIWKDDNQVIDLHVSKWYSEKPRVEVTVKELNG